MIPTLPTLPALDCQRRCQQACVPIRMSPHERARIAVNHRRVPHTLPGSARCSLLTSEGACSVYEDRPLVCRLWGVVDSMKCPHGCAPSKYLTASEALDLMGSAWREAIRRW